METAIAVFVYTLSLMVFIVGTASATLLFAKSERVKAEARTIELRIR